MKPWLKAGLIGGVVLSVLTILTSVSSLLSPEVGGVVGCCLCIPFLLAYPGIGALAALWLPAPRTAGTGAKEGAIAGVVAGAIDGLISVVMTVATGTGMYQQAFQQLPPESLYALEEMGLMNLFSSTAGLAALGCCGGLVGILWAAVWGAVGGAILAATKKE